jgi:hypothetical protein
VKDDDDPVTTVLKVGRGVGVLGAGWWNTTYDTITLYLSISLHYIPPIPVYTCICIPLNLYFYPFKCTFSLYKCTFISVYPPPPVDSYKYFKIILPYHPYILNPFPTPLKH